MERRLIDAVKTNRVKTCFLILLIIVSFTNPAISSAQNKASPSELSEWIARTSFTWSDNGNVLGTIVFAANGQGKASWSGDIHYWRVDAHGDLIVSANGTQYVTRFIYESSAGLFTGSREASSQVQDGVRAVLMPASPLQKFEQETFISIVDRLKVWILNSSFSWSDNGSTLGTIFFYADGSGKASWSSDIHYWKVDANGDLVVSAMGRSYVTRFILDFSTGSFIGLRDESSLVQDGVQASLKALR